MLITNKQSVRDLSNCYTLFPSSLHVVLDIQIIYAFNTK